VPKKKKYLNGSLYGNFNSNPQDKFNYLFSNIIDAHYDYILGKTENKFKAISLSDVITGQPNGSMEYPNSARLITRQVIVNGIASSQTHLAIKVRPINIDGSTLPDPFDSTVTNQYERNFIIGMHEWAISDIPVDNVANIPAGTEITCFYSDGRDIGFNERTLFFEAASAGSSFMSIIAQPFGVAAGMLGNMFSNFQNPSYMSDFQNTYLNIPAKWPNSALPTISSAVITSPFGPRRPPVTSGGRGSSNHGGIDIAGGNLPQYPGGRGSPIYSVHDGTISRSGAMGKAGLTVIINHPGGWVTKYMHLNSITVKNGQTVSKGQVIGTMGTTGNSSGVHLHFQVEKDKKKVDPLLVFGWSYKWSSSRKEQEYKQRLKAAGIQMQSQPSPQDNLFPPESEQE